MRRRWAMIVLVAALLLPAAQSVYGQEVPPPDPKQGSLQTAPEPEFEHSEPCSAIPGFTSLG